MVRMKVRVNQTGTTGAALLSLLTATGALAASSCCALPLALSVAGFGGAWLGGLSQLAEYRPHFLTAAALALVLSAFAPDWVLRNVGGRRPAIRRPVP